MARTVIVGIDEELRQAIIDGDVPAAKACTEAGLAAGQPAAVFFARSVAPAMDEVGRLMGAGEFFIPEVLMAARAARAVSERLRPLLAADSPVAPAGTVLLAVVKGDLHDIGKNIVAMMLEGAGFRVVDLGVDVSAERIVAGVDEHHPDVVGLSALLTTTMGQIRTSIAALRAAEVGGSVRVMVGGAPITEEWALSVGADAYGRDAPAAVAAARGLMRRPGAAGA